METGSCNRFTGGRSTLTDADERWSMSDSQYNAVMQNRNSVAAYEPYVRNLETMADQARSYTAHQEELTAALDGQPSQRLRELVDLATRRDVGAFFTSAHLRGRVADLLGSGLDSDALILDPACGAGDLLLACASQLPVAGDLETTIKAWGQRIHGYDIHSEFVRAARARLVMAAAMRCRSETDMPSEISADAFPHVCVRDALDTSQAISLASHMVLNPPYAAVDAPDSCVWGSGKVSAAAVFVESVLSRLATGTQVIAILPDVLRAGSRYRKWRSRIEQLSSLESVEVIGQFDRWTDVDVFLAHLIVGGSEGMGVVRWWHNIETSGQKHIRDYFAVGIGPVVPHRDPNKGPWRKYIYARLLSGLGSFNSDTAKCRRYAGRCFTPPFVVVRRTTRPNRRTRILGTVVEGNSPVAVENHLIVLEPRDGTLDLCDKLIQSLHAEQTQHWLDERIRCRHFTVPSLSELPWWGPGHEL